MAEILEKHSFRRRGYVFGWLRYSGQTELSQTCLLDFTRESFRVLIPFRRGASEVERWFLPISDASNDVTKDNALPSKIWIIEVETRTCFNLVGCEIVEKSATIKPGAAGDAWGFLRPHYVVKGVAQVDYANVSVLRSSFSGLYRWLGRSAATLSFSPDDASEASFPTLDLRPTREEIANLFQSAFFLSDPGLEVERPWHAVSIEIRPRGWFETRFVEPATLEEAIRKHRRLAMLFEIMHWRKIRLDSVQVLFDLQIAGGDEDAVGVGEVLRSPSSPAPFDISGMLPLFFEYDEVGPAGVARWFELCQVCERGIERLSNVAARHDEMTMESVILSLCSAVEEITDACSPSVIGNPPYSFRNKLGYLREDLVARCPELKFSDVDVFQSDISNTYNAVKHTKEERGGRPRECWLSPDNLLDVELAIRILLTAWIARRMGCPEAKVFELFEYEAAPHIGDRWAFFRPEVAGGADSLIDLEATESVQEDS